MSEAEEILSDAVAWWDVERSGFRDGDRWLRNLGTGGSALDLRLGSSLRANSNDPKWLGPDATGYVYLPGVASHSLSVPNATPLQITGDIDIRVRVGLDTWTPGATSALIAKSGAGGTDDSWQLYLSVTGRLRFQWSVTGSIANNLESSVATGFEAGTVSWVRVAFSVAPNFNAKFYTSDDGVTWTQLGTTQTGSGSTSIFNSTKPVTVGTTNTSNPIAGRVYRAQVLSGIDGTTVLDIDCDVLSSGAATSFTEQSSNAATVTINRSTSGRKSVVMPSRAKGGRACMLLGTDDYLEVQDAQQHGLLNFYGGDSFTLTYVARDWAVDNATYYYIAKRSTSPNLYPGWIMTRYGNSLVNQIYDPNNTGYASSTVASGLTAGSMFIGTHVRNTTTRTGVTYRSTTAGTAQRDNSGSLATSARLQIGQFSGGSYAAIEFRAAAIWRRALSTREITVLANSNLWGT